MRFKEQHKKPGKRLLKPSVTESMQNRYVLWKKKWAVWMGNQYNRLSLKYKIVTLACFVVLTGGYSIFLVASAFKGKQSAGHAISHISLPLHIETIVPRHRLNYTIQDKEYQRIHRFRMYMDSLSKDPTGRSIYDSIIRRRPGLMDSVYSVDNNFSSRGYDKNR